MAGTFGGQLERRVRNPQQRAYYFYLLFVFVHKYPRAAWDEIHASADGMFRSSDSAARQEVYDIAWALDNIIQEIDYGWRLDAHNHGPWPFDVYYTGTGARKAAWHLSDAHADFLLPRRHVGM